MPQFKRGDIIKCFQVESWLRNHLTLRKTYVVSKIKNKLGVQNILIVNDYGIAIMVPHAYFRLYKRNPKP